MSRSEFVEKMRQTLVNRRDAIMRTLSGELSQFSISGEREVGDVLDAALDADYGAINANLAEVESRELAKIENALNRIENGTYGVCQSCGKRIPQVRLKAVPYATLCVKCQQEEERRTPRSGASATWNYEVG